MPPLHGGGDRNVRTEENSMKRSEINAALKEMEGMIRDYRIALPPFCYFTPEEWQQKGHEFDEVRDNMLGWDITDYGLGRFDEVGFSLITLRNGNLKKKDRYPKPYAEKLLYLKEGQYSPMHFHWYKMEDIINRGGGTVLIRVYNADEKEELDRETPVTVHTDGETRTVPAGTQIVLEPGQSISITQKLYHATMTTATTASTRRWAASRPSKRMRRPIACSAANIRRQKNKHRTDRHPGRTAFGRSGRDVFYRRGCGAEEHRREDTAGRYSSRLFAFRIALICDLASGKRSFI